MKKPLGKIKDLLAPTDGIALAVVIIGLLIAIFLQRAEIRLIGVSVAILGMVAFFMLISQRLRDIISSKPFNIKPPADLTVTEKHDLRAKRQVIEGFENSFGDEPPAPKVQKNEKIGFNDSKDGFKVVDKNGSKEINSTDSISPKASDFSSAENPKNDNSHVKTMSSAEEAIHHQYEEEISGVRIIGKKSINNSEKQKNINKDVNVGNNIKNNSAEQIPNLKLETVYSDKAAPNKAVINEKFVTSDKQNNDNLNKNNAKSSENTNTVTEKEVNTNDEIKSEGTLFDFVDTKQDKETSQSLSKQTEKVKFDDEKKEFSINNDNKNSLEAVEDINKVISNSDNIKSDNNAKTGDKAEILNVETEVEPKTQRESKPVQLIIKKAKEEKSEYELKKERIENYKKNKVDVPISLLVDDSMLSEEEPRKQFEAFLTRVLMVIRSMASTNTVAFLLVNMDKEELVLESYVTDIPDAIIKNSKIKMGNDVISQIVNSSKPEILTEINPAAELDLIPYYAKPVGCSSFIGVPVFYKNSVMGIICADTDIPDAYDTVTIGFLGHFTKLISGLTLNYTEKHELLQASKSLEAINTFRKFISSSKINISDISNCAVEAIAPIFDYNTIGICTYDDSDGSWRIFALKNKNDAQKSLIGASIDLTNTLIGDTVINGRIFSADINDKSPVRVHKSEIKMSKGYFVSVPLNSVSNNYGALYMELKSRSGITNYDIKLLEMLAEHAGSAIEQVHLTKLLNTSSIMDPETGILNAPAFYMRLNEELARCRDFKNNITLFGFKIDNYASFNTEEHIDRLQKVIYGVIEIMKKHIKEYDVFGKIERETFGVALYGLSLTDAQLWAERVRSEIAKNVISINSKKFSVTISGGLAMAGKKDSAEELIQNVNQVLDISLKKTNCVSIFA